MSTKLDYVKNITADLDRVASVLQKDFSALGIPEKIATDFAYRCDLLSDAMEKQAADEAGMSAPTPAGDFDATVIGDQVPGPLVSDNEPFMKGEFTQQEFQELREKQESGSLGKMATALDKLAGLALVSTRSDLISQRDAMQGLLGKFGSSVDQVAFATGITRQVHATNLLVAALEEMASTGTGSPEILVAADKARQALAEVLPVAEVVCAGQDVDMATAVKIAALATRVVEDASKSVSV